MFIDKSFLLSDNPTQLNYGMAVVDVDDDQQFEVIVAGFGVRNQVLKWMGSTFTDQAEHELADEQRQAIGVAAADINDDGREEIYVLNTDTFAGAKRYGDRLFLHRGLKWVDLFDIKENAAISNMTAGRSVVAVDRTGTGRYGFFIANYGGAMRLYEFTEEGLLTDVASQVGVNFVSGGRGLVSFPIVSEKMDIFLGNEHGTNFLFVNNGTGGFTEQSSEYGLSDPGEHVRGVSVVDVRQDGRLGLVYGNWEGQHRLFYHQDDGTFVDVAPETMAIPSRVRTVIAADFDNDGYEEIFFNNIGEPNRLFAWRDGNWQQISIGDALEADGFGTGAVCGDFDGDGHLELLISHGESRPQPLTYYHTKTNAEWLRVMPLTRFGAPARGAVVRLVQANRQQVRAIDAGSGYLCQMEPVAHFGLGTNPEPIEFVEVRWPDGQTHRVEAPLPRQLLRIPHPSSA